MENKKCSYNRAVILPSVYSKDEQTLLEAVYYSGGTDQPIDELVRDLASGGFPTSTDSLWDVMTRNPRRWFVLYVGDEGRRVRRIPNVPFS